MTQQDLRSTRREYSGELRRNQLKLDPVEQFKGWMEEALEFPVTDATAMALATADDLGQPSVRMVLLKHYGVEGFCWYTDKRSPSGQELLKNPRAELLFYWQAFNRQVRISGRVEALADDLNEEYFSQRPEACQFSASASHQSDIVENRGKLESAIEALHLRYPDGSTPRPEQWGGYALIPESFEFWQGRESRLHDRFKYRRQAQQWVIERLAP
jgi:pyridoxamine 5'-phosphate oxidase